MVDAKHIADLITVLRGFLAFLLAWLGLTWGRTGLVGAVVVMLVDWTGDFFDGRIARLSRQPRQTWVGNHDLHVDVLVSLGLSAYLLGSGYLNQWVAFWYFVLWVLIIWKSGPDQNVLMLFQAPIYLYFMIVAMREAPSAGRLLIIWVCLVLAINWRIFTCTIVPNFIHGISALMGNGKHSHL